MKVIRVDKFEKSGLSLRNLPPETISLRIKPNHKNLPGFLKGTEKDYNNNKTWKPNLGKIWISSGNYSGIYKPLLYEWDNPDGGEWLHVVGPVTGLKNVKSSSWAAGHDDKNVKSPIYTNQLVIWVVQRPVISFFILILVIAGIWYLIKYFKG